MSCFDVLFGCLLGYLIWMTIWMFGLGVMFRFLFGCLFRYLFGYLFWMSVWISVLEFSLKVYFGESERHGVTICPKNLMSEKNFNFPTIHAQEIPRPTKGFSGGVDILNFFTIF